MKKIYSFIMMVFCVSAYVFAQDNYYYYKGSQIPIEIDGTKVVSIMSNASPPIISKPAGFVLEQTMGDTTFVVNVYRRTSLVVQQPGSFHFFPCYKTSNGTELVPNGYINVKLRNSADYSLLEEVATQNECVILGQNSFMPLWYTLKIIENSYNNPVDIANRIYETGYFSSSFPSFSMDALEISYDSEISEQWGLYNAYNAGYDISVSQAWNYATGRGITIAIIDEGIELTHQDLSANIYHLSYDTETSSSPSQVYGDHGTHCAGIAAAVRNNGIQIAGVAPDAKLMSVSNMLTSINIEKKLADGINWAWSNGADVISCSWRCMRNEIIDNAIDSAVIKGREGRGCVFVKSAGNGAGAITYPGNYGPQVLAVANITQDGTLKSNSSYGENMFIAAPGTYILSTVLKNQTDYKTGTSMACPHVAGVAALILERNPRLSAVKVREIMARNAKKIGSYSYSKTKVYGTWNEHYGYGLVDAYNSVINTPRN